MDKPKRPYKKRFLRDGVLDQMIEKIREYDKKSWTTHETFMPSLASIIQLFQLNRFILKQLETQIEKLREKDSELYHEFKNIAAHLQEGMRSTFEGLEEECDSIVFCNETDDLVKY